MYSVVIAFGLASAMLCLGMAIRAKIPFFGRMLIPSSVIGGIFGFLLVNLVVAKVDIGGTTVTDFSNIVDVFFVMSFISIGLTGSRKEEPDQPEQVQDKRTRKKSGGMVPGAIGMALIWCILYAVQPLTGILITAGIGGLFNMEAMYGILLPFAFCQGPGQASTYGRLFENTYGYENAEMVALTFAAIGFLAAFVVGVPLARYGLKKGLVKSSNTISATVERGYFLPEEQHDPMGSSTCHSANIETFAAHFAVMGVSYLLALAIAQVIALIPAIGETFSAMLFMWGMFAAYIVRAVMKKLKIDYLIDSTFQSRVTGFFSDYLVVCAFMAIQISVIGEWLVPIILISLAGAAATYFISLYFGQRLGSDHDFERVLGVYGTSTGTTPSGLSLVRIVDPNLETSTGAELGIMNMAMILSTPTMLFITFAGLDMLSLPIACVGMFLSIFIYLVVLKMLRVWRKPTFTLKNGRIPQEPDDRSCPHPRDGAAGKTPV